MGPGGIAGEEDMRTTENKRWPFGVFAASLTPFREDLTIDLKTMADHCHRLLANGCDGILICGTTGEASSLTVQERVEILDALLEDGIPPERLLVGTGSCALPDTVRLTRHAFDNGVCGVVILPPFYFKSVKDDGIFEGFRHVIEAVASDELQIYLYHIPQFTRLPFTVQLIERLIEHFPGNIAGIKDSSGDWEHMKYLCEKFPSLKIFSGSDKFLLDILQIGGSGTISATANLTGHLSAQVMEQWQGMGEAAMQDTVTAIRNFFEHFEMIPALKAYLAHQQAQSNWQFLRPPLMPLSGKHQESLIKSLDKMPMADDTPNNGHSGSGNYS